MEDVIEMGTTGIAPDNELEQRYIRYKDVIKELTIMNDIFMRNVLKKRECAEYILRIIMEMKDLQVVDHIVQKDFTVQVQLLVYASLLSFLQSVQ